MTLLADPRISQLIIHRIPSKKDSEAGPELSQTVGVHNPGVVEYFQRRLRSVLHGRGQLVVRDDRADLRATDAISALLKEPQKLVLRSQELATLLHDAQDRRNSAGILVVALATVESLPAVGMLKLEHERGVRAEEHQTSSGQMYFQVVIHDDLMLTDRTQIFKASLFRPTSNTDERLIGRAADEQVDTLASFFLGKFLGCQLQKRSAVATEEYFNVTEKVIKTIDAPDRRARAEIALLNAMQSPMTRDIDPVRFANDALQAPDHQRFLDALTDAGLGHGTFKKDIMLIEKRIQRVAYDFESGIKLMGKPDAMEQHVHVAEPGTVGPRVTIDDEIIDVKSRG